MSTAEPLVAARRPRVAGPTFASLLEEPDLRANEAFRRLALQALIPLILVAGLLMVWALTAPLSGAVVAEGRLKFEQNRKTVQHPEGGIVREILVRDGQLVRAGQPLLVIGDVHNDAELSPLPEQLASEGFVERGRIPQLPRDPLLDIVPTHEKLVVEARIRPQDMSHVREGSAAEVRFTAFDTRTTPLLAGTLVFVSPDLTTAPDGHQWFVATVEVDAAPLAGHPEIRLHAGMPAELFVTTPERTLVEYLTEPFTAFAHRAMREP